MMIDVHLVAAVPRAPIPRARSERDNLHPLALREALASGLDRQVFPLLDTRTRYWRYYLLIGPKPRWTLALGKRLIAVVRANIDGQRARRGAGARLWNRCVDLGRRPTEKELRTLVRSFRSQYSVAAGEFWRLAETDSGFPTLASAARRLKRHKAYRGFFDTGALSNNPDGHARRVFHRLIRNQSDGAAEFARLFARHAYSVWWALAAVKASTLKRTESRRIALAWSLLRSLYRLPWMTVGQDGEDADDDGDAEEALGDRELADLYLRLATCALASLQREVDGQLTSTAVARIEELLRAALREPDYRQPLVPPLLEPGQKVQRLFPDLRLQAFARLLEQTAS